MLEIYPVLAPLLHLMPGKPHQQPGEERLQELQDEEASSPGIHRAAAGSPAPAGCA